jgi:adenylate cyclase
VDADRCTFFLVNRHSHELWSMQGELDIRIPMDAGIAGWVATHGKLLNIPDAYDVLQFARACLAFSLERHSAPCVLLAQDARFNKAVDVSTGYRTKSVLCMPFIGTDGTVVGVIQLINKETGPFDEDDIDIMTMFASMAAPIVQVQFLFGCRACLDVCICHMFVMCGSPRRTHNCSRVWQRNPLRNRAQSSAENPCCPSGPR